jgi:diacylglycerol kinase (ATP)
VKVRAILNPRAGLAARRALAAFETVKHSWSLDVCLTERAGHATDLARESAERRDDLVLAVGGDGTTNEVVRGLLGSETTLGLIPAGSGNGLGRILGLSLSPPRALAQLLDAEVKRMDVGRINGRPFVNVAGFGFDAAVGAAFHDWGRGGGRRGILPYVLISVRQVRDYASVPCRIAIDGQAFEMPVFMATFANGRQFGGGAVIAPRAYLDDGLLNIVIIEDRRRAEIILNAVRLFLGNIDGYRHCHSYVGHSVRLEAANAAAHHRDGEPEDGTPLVEVTLEPRALPVLVPRATLSRPDSPFVA